MEEPLLPHPTAAVSAAAAADSYPSTTTVLTRLSSVLFVAAVSVWANHEASKGFEITVLNSAAGSPAGHRFDVMFVSNGKASRIVHGASRFVERALFPDDDCYPRKPVGRVTLQLASHNFTGPAVSSGPVDYIITVSPSLVSRPDASAAVASAVHRGMARVWLWDGQGAAPPDLLDAVAEYLTASAGFPLSPSASGPDGAAASDADGPYWTAGGSFLRYCEEQSLGFVAQLNREMQWRWSERAVDDALGSPAQRIWAAYRRRAGLGSDALWRDMPGFRDVSSGRVLSSLNRRIEGRTCR